jgi:general secretion pathway protein D
MNHLMTMTPGRLLLLPVLALVMLFNTNSTWGQEPPGGSPAVPKGANAPLQAADEVPRPAAVKPPAVSNGGRAPAKAPTIKPGEVLLNFQAADIQAVVKAVSQMTRRNFLLDPRVKGQITIISARPVSTAAAYQIFLSALKAQGFTAVEGIGVTKIVPATEAKTGADVSLQGVPRGGEQMMTHIQIVQHSSASQMIPLLRPLMSPTSQLSAYDPANALIITDYADNIRRLLRIVEKVDQPVSGDVTIIPLTHASALDLADTITRLTESGAVRPGAPGVPQAVGGAGDRLTIIPDPRTNSLLVRADNPGRVNQVRSLVAKLDVPAVSGGQTRVIYLRNADAVKLAEVLRGLLSGEARAQTAAAAPVAGLAAGLRPTGASRATEASLIQADEATNALIINAPDAVYNNLRGVIEKLDVRRTQVYVEALIVEMRDDTADELGIQWAAAGPAGSGAIAGVQNFPSANPGIANAVVNPTSLASAGGLLIAYLGDRITLPDGTVVRSLGALARALEQRSLANVLSTPNLLTLDNAEAKITVGQNVPFVTGSYAQAASTGTTGVVNPFQTIERKDVGLTLKIKPQISEGGLIKMDIYQEVSSIAPTSVAGASDLVTNKRTIETKVLVDDGHTVILGGLIEDDKTVTEQAVPFLGRLPLIGGLFRYRSKTGTRTNLMVFLRPVIIHSPQESYSLTTDRYEYLRSQTRSMQRQDMIDRFKPAMPAAPPAKGRENKKNGTDADKTPPPAAPAPTDDRNTP